jgi:hypothetical protein
MMMEKEDVQEMHSNFFSSSNPRNSCYGLLTYVRGTYSNSVLYNPVAIRHMWQQAILMWRQEVFPEAVLQSKHQLNCCFIG